MYSNLVDEDEPPSRYVSLHFILILLFGSIVILMAGTIIVCSTNNECAKNVPTMNNLMKQEITLPYLMTAMNILFLLFVICSAGIYYMTNKNHGFFGKLLFLSVLATLSSIIVTLFLFPMTSWDKDYANLLIIGSILIWMFSVDVCLWRYYRNLVYSHKIPVFWNLVTSIVYLFASVGYTILHIFFSKELSGILAVEISSAVSFFVFLLVCGYQILKIKVCLRVA